MLTAVVAALGAGKTDLVMGTSPPIFQAVSAWFVAAIRRKPFLLEVRDLWPEFAIDMGVLKNPLLIKLSRWLERFLYARADCIVVNSPAYVDYLCGKQVPNEKVRFIPYGTDVEMFGPEIDGQTVRQQLGVSNAFVVVYAGALGIANDIDTVLRAAERLLDTPDIRIILFGDGKERPRLEETARLRGLTNVVFAGARPKNEMPTVLAASDVCLAILQDIPMFRTTYPNKVFDYMAAGKPTVLAIDGVIRQVIEEAHAGVFVAPHDDQALAQAVRDLYADPHRVRRMGAAARDHVCEHFERGKQIEAFSALLESLRR
jgi:glycosyltransferase involved in cell wall biosynthesis